MEKIDKVREYCRQNKSMPNLTLAKIIFRENPSDFTSIEHCRNMVRKARGLYGQKARSFQARSIVEYMPDADISPWRVPEIPLSVTSVLLLPDIHIPYHDKRAIEIAVEAGKRRKVNGVVYTGDTLDCYQLSDFSKDPKARRFKDEVALFHQMRSWVSRRLNKPREWFKVGNHEERYETLLRRKAPELADFKEFELSSILKCQENGIILVDRKKPLSFGRLSIIHGHEFGGFMSAPVNPARTLYMKSKTHAIMGHLHRDSQHSEASPIDKKVVTTWSMGCLCGLRPEYRPLNNWSHGFAIISRAGKDGNFRVENFKIIDNTIYPA